MIPEFLDGKIKVKIRPNSLKNEITGFEDNVLFVNISKPAVDNKANKELIKFLSKTLKKKVRIKSGFTGREKVIEVL
jgi:uncharacterized protein (TIGR00251 family)